MARAVCDLPEPDSPTIASFSRPSVKETSRTTWLMPVGVLNRMFSFWTSRIGLAIVIVPADPTRRAGRHPSG
jgi:hypothetical protein